MIFKTAGQIATAAIRMLGVIDAEEQPTTSEINEAVYALDTLICAEHMDGASQYLITRQAWTLPALQGSFFIGTAQAAYDIQSDIVGVRRIDAADVGPYIRREVRWAPMVDIVRTTFPGRLTKAHQERQADGSVLVSVWQVPQQATPLLIEIGGRIPAITSADEIIPFPKEGVNAAEHMLAKKIYASYGRSPQAIPDVLALATKYEMQWNSYARGQQWMRTVR